VSITLDAKGSGGAKWQAMRHRVGRARDTEPCALAIGGLDPGGGAGVAADLRAFSAAGAFGCAVATLITVQSTAGLRRVVPLDAQLVIAQAEEVLGHQSVRAIKVGALGSIENVRAVARLLDHLSRSEIPVVVDTPMRPSVHAKGRARLTAGDAISTMKRALLPRATLVTVNAPEAEELLGERVRTVGEARAGALELARACGCAVLVKGGHIEGPSAVDVLASEHRVVTFRARRLDVGPVHGTGCTLASLIAGRLAVRSGSDAKHQTLVAAVRWARKVHHAALVRPARVGTGMRVLRF
jgi:hydroxymethylpyrimidine kinase/phosphomethylpyrimidine kinase